MEKVQCPKCKSYKTSKGSCAVLILGILVAFVGLIIWPIFPIGLLLIIGYFILLGAESLKIAPVKYVCFNCNYNFEVEKK